MQLGLFTSKIIHANRTARHQTFLLKPLISRLFQNSARSIVGELEQYYAGVRPASVPYYVGTDICHIPRIERLLYIRSQEPNGSSEEGSAERATYDLNKRFMERVFTDFELEYIYRRRFPSTQRSSQRAQFANFVAGRWAAKEAIIKSSPPGRRLTLRDVIICQISDQPDKPRGIILDRTCSAEFEDMRLAASKGPPDGTFPPVPDSVVRLIRAGPNLQGQEVRISISHDGEYATAVAIAHYDDNMATTPKGGY